MSLVSVILPAYNHENYVGQAIESVLNQTFQDFELLISDDCSPDNTVDIIKKYTDSRIKTNFFKKNQGAATNHRYLIEQATGKYIALINSDDVWLPERLEKQVNFMENNSEYSACFSWASFIDENNTPIMQDTKIFMQPNRTQGEWLSHFFTQGNCICHPSMLIKKEVYTAIGTYNPALRQLPDFYEWIQVVKNYKIYIYQEVLVLHRRFINVGGENTSAPILSNSMRDVMESYFILNSFFDDISDKIFIEGFQKYFKNKNAHTQEELICEKYFLLLENKYYMPKIGLQAAILYFMKHFKNEKVRSVFQLKYNYTDRDFFAVSCQIDLLSLLPEGINSCEENKFDIDKYIKKNRMKTIAAALFEKDSAAYKILKGIYKKFHKQR